MRRFGTVLAIAALLASACANNDEVADPLTTSAAPAATDASDEQATEERDSFDSEAFIDCGLTVLVPRHRSALDSVPSPTADELAGIATGASEIDMGPLEDWALIEAKGVLYRHRLTERSDAVLMMAAGSEGPGLCAPEGEPASAAPVVCVASDGLGEVAIMWFGPAGVSTVDIYRNGELQVGDLVSNGEKPLPSDLDWAVDDLLVDFGNPPLSWVRPSEGRFRPSGAFSDRTAPLGDVVEYELRVQYNDVRSGVVPCSNRAADVELSG